MSLLTAVSRYVPFLNRTKPSLPREQMLALRPLRNPVVTWERREAEEEAAGKALLTVPRRDSRTAQLLTRLFQIPLTKTIELDEFGSDVWERCDGQHTVDQLVKETCARYKLNRRQGEISVTAFMRMLTQRHLIGFITKDLQAKELQTGEKASSHVSQQSHSKHRQRRSGGAHRR